MLTTLDKRIIAFIDDFIKERGYSPTVREIQTGTEAGGLDTIHKHLRYLKKLGVVDWQEKQARTLRIIYLPVTA